MKKLFSLLIVAGMTLAAAPAAHAEKPVRDGVFIHVSRGADDPHRLLMALNMATVMAPDHDVLMYFDINAVHVLLEDAPDLTFAKFPSSKTQLAKLLKHGVTIMACPSCLDVLGKSASDLADGIQLADKDAFFSFTQGRILTLDY